MRPSPLAVLMSAALVGSGAAMAADSPLCQGAIVSGQVTPATPQQIPARLHELSFAHVQTGNIWVTPARAPASVAWRVPAATLQSVLAQHMANRWQVSVPHAKNVIQAACAAGQEFQVDPTLILAVAARETRLRHVGNPGGSGEDPAKPYGIMQVYGKWHPEKFPEHVIRPTSLSENIRMGAWVLKEYLVKEHQNTTQALLRYVGGAHAKWYADRVLHYQAQFNRLILGIVA